MPRKRKKKATNEEAKCRLCGGVVATEKRQEPSYRQIPGFIYDTEKKKYFRITNENQCKRTTPTQKGNTEPKICKKCTEAKRKRLKKRPNSSFVKYIFSRQYQQKNPLISQSETMEKIVQQYGVHQSSKLHLTHVYAPEFAVTSIHLNAPVELKSDRSSSELESKPEAAYDEVKTTKNGVRISIRSGNLRSFYLSEPDFKHQRILTLYKTSGSGDPIVQFHKVSKDRNQKMSIVPGSAMMKDQLVTSLNWSPHPKTSDFFLITLLGHGDKWGEGLLFQVDELTQRFVGRYPMNRHSVWTSAWNRNPLYDHVISLGASNLALTFDVNTRHRLVRFPSLSDTFAQQFAVKSPVLFNGFRNGEIKSADIRLTGSRVPCLYMSQPTPVTCIKLLQDETYLITSGLDSTIRKWDLRMQRIVQEYHGHVNQNTLRLPFYVDSTDSLLFAAGEDSLTRVWSIRTGEIVRTIPYPANESTQIVSVPAICYSDEWGGPRGLPGLMYGTNDNVRLYST